MANKKKKFDWNAFKGNKEIVVHCTTEKEANEFCRLMHEHGMKWISGNSYLTCNIYDYEDTCYHGNGQYCDLEWANENGWEILKFSAYDFTD